MSGRRTRDVVVIGGGLVGLTTALELRHHGVDVVLLEKHPTTSPQPKARRFGFRSMEVFRSLGLAGTVRDAARDLAGHDRFAAGETLASSELQPMWGGAPIEPSPDRVGPEPPSLVAQDVLEPVLARAATDAGADVRFGLAVRGVAPDADGVTVDTGAGEVCARYVVAADGARSPVREALGVTRSGAGAVGAPAVNVYFRADLAALVADRPFNLCTVDGGAFASVDGRHRWVFMTGAGQRDWPAVLRSAIGAPVPDLEVLSVLGWCPEVRVADRFRVGEGGRVLLAGDAAHVMPPWAAAGANTGIADAHNLGWKLAAVLRGEASDGLLDCYDAERRPTAAFVADQSARRSSARAAPDPGLAHPFVLSAESLAYPEGAFVPDDRDEPVTAFAPSGSAGVRVPHRWIGPGLSTLDLAGPAWATFDDDGERVLLRPDGVVAWRGTDPDGPERHRRALLAGAVPPGSGPGRAAPRH